MKLIAFDTNVLVYAELEKTTPKGRLARRLISVLTGQGIMPAQVLGEFLTVVRRRLPTAWSEARRQAEAYRSVFSIVPTDADLVLAAAAFAERYRLQFWDAVVWQASRQGGASILLTEDMQNGFTTDGMRALDPFVAPDWTALAADLGISA